ncbi:response regulator [Candidatus Reidiella endopervernicosa]|uniref:Response regulator n=1 Tax=Candidatus Reidiella endopervernicosa TaxID=2738883 RepID=A0A6N0HX97_9GAMM|nr:response regulator [Candidatus Reidiella endopervernicosa]
MSQESPFQSTTSTLKEHKITVLLIDDQAMIGEGVRRMLADEKDIDFHFCSDPTDAMTVANEIRPTVILQDLVMPEVDGLTLVKFFRANPLTKDIPMIVLSSKEEATTKAEAFARGANDYMVKLPDQIELIARIRYHSKGYINLLQRNEAFTALRLEQEKAEKLLLNILPAPIAERLKSGNNTIADYFAESSVLFADIVGFTEFPLGSRRQNWLQS